jgi:2-polyprenyl-6-methoxyphenol hydroxylase-like FAD-dependent oxidoreductase
MEQAVVLGASIGGLLAARTLSDFYSTVLVIERDDLPGDARSRRGTPQDKHLHALLARGAQALDESFPGLVDELVSAGVPSARFLSEVRYVLSGHELVRADLGARNIQPTRPVLEHAVRTRVADLANVKIMDGYEVTGLNGAKGGVTGVRVRHRAAIATEERVDADLVVDATGRGGRAGTWLRQLGYDSPPEEKISCNVTYTSRLLRVPDGAMSDRLVVVGPVRGHPYAMALAAHEGDRWMLTVGGMAGRRPPTDDAGLLEIVRQTAPADVYRAVEDAEPSSAAVTHRFPASIRRRYERLRRFPAGLLVLGDAMCSFNPVYGQGMTVAALEAEALRACLQANDEDLAHRYFRLAARVIDPAWQLAASGDLAVPGVRGRRTPQVRLINRYVRTLHRAARRDPVLASAFLRVTGLIDPPSAITKPNIMARVLAGGPHSRT